MFLQLLSNAYKKKQNTIILPSKVCATTGIIVEDIRGFYMCKISDRLVHGFHIVCGVIWASYVVFFKHLYDLICKSLKKKKIIIICSFLQCVSSILNCSDIFCLIFQSTILTGNYYTKPNFASKESLQETKQLLEDH